jgi:hypothetical protein
MELAAQRKIAVWVHIALDFPAKGSIAVHVDGLLLSPPRPAPSAGLWWCKHREGCGADAEDEDNGQQATPQASNEPRKG